MSQAQDLSRKSADNRPQESLPTAGSANTAFKVEDIFMITGKGCVAAGMVEQGTFRVGDKVNIIRGNTVYASSVITGIEKLRKILQSASRGENVGILLQGMKKGDISPGDIVIKAN